MPASACRSARSAVTSSATSKLRRPSTIVTGTAQFALPVRSISMSAWSASVALRVSAYGWPNAIARAKLLACVKTVHENAVGAA